MAPAAGEARSWVLLGGLGLAALVAPFGCGPVTDDGSPSVQGVADLLAAVGPEVVEPHLAAVDAAVTALVAATEALEAAPDDPAARETAQEAWFDAMDAWQRVEVMQIGPLAPSATAVGGQDLRDEVYSWPTVSPCAVDQETVDGDHAAADFPTTTLVNVRGLDALEHLLFVEGTDNACPAQVDINADGTWDALGEAGVRSARAAYAADLAGFLASDVTAVREAWTGDGGFSATLAEAGGEGSAYASTTEALNAVYDALFYVETRVKDAKLARPLGLRDCASERCPDAVESRPAGGSVDWIAANVEGFRALFTAGDAFGMDDLLRDLGHGDVADEILADLDALDAAVLAVDLPIDRALTEDLADLEALHAALVDLTDDVKGDLATVLSLRIPAEAAGDND